MTEIVLYTYEQEKFNPLSKICSDISIFYGFDLKKVIVQKSWTSIGDLPILRVNSFLYTSDQILGILQHLYNIDSDLSQEELNFFTMVEEICYSRLHHGTLFAICNPTEPAMFFLSKLNKAKRWISNSVFNTSESRTLNAFGNRNIKTSQNAFELVDDSHRLLSEILEDKKFFSSKFARKERPRTVDFVVYAYLKEELVYLSEHPHVKHSLDDYQNLKEFVKTMALTIEKAAVERGNEVKVKVQMSSEKENFLKRRAFGIKNSKEADADEKEVNSRRKFVTACAFLFFGYLLINNE